MNSLLTIPRRASFSCLSLPCLFLSALRSPAVKGLTFWHNCVLCFLVFCHCPIWCSGSGMELVCIDSGFLPSSLLCFSLYRTMVSSLLCFSNISHDCRLGSFKIWSVCNHKRYFKCLFVWCRRLLRQCYTREAKKFCPFHDKKSYKHGISVQS